MFCMQALFYCSFWLFKWLASMTGTVFPHTTPSNYKIAVYCNKAVSARRQSLSELRVKSLDSAFYVGKLGKTRSFVRWNLTRSLENVQLYKDCRFGRTKEPPMVWHALTMSKHQVTQLVRHTTTTTTHPPIRDTLSIVSLSIYIACI